MVIFRFKKYGVNLGTRQLGSLVRSDLEKVLKKGEKVVLDFEGVEMVGNSFADECLGKLLLDMSLEELEEKTTFRNLEGLSKLSVSTALRRRYNSLIVETNSQGSDNKSDPYKEDKSEICVAQSISVGESSFFLLYIELAASSCRPLRISSTKKEIPSFIVFIKDYSGNVPKRGYLYTRLPNMYIINLLQINR